MKYTDEQRLEIGRQIYHDELSGRMAAEKYGISDWTARNSMRLYRDVSRFPPKPENQNDSGLNKSQKVCN